MNHRFRGRKSGTDDLSSVEFVKKVQTHMPTSERR